MAKLRVFIASSFLNKARVREVAKALKREGFEVTSTWTVHRPTENLKVLAGEAIKDIEQLTSSHALLVLWPGRTGTMTEMGVALGVEMPVVVCLDGYAHFDLANHLYFNHPAVAVTEHLPQAITKLREAALDLGKER